MDGYGEVDGEYIFFLRSGKLSYVISDEPDIIKHNKFIKLIKDGPTFRSHFHLFDTLDFIA